MAISNGVIPALGTCGQPRMAHIQDQNKLKGDLYHSSQLDGKTAEGKRVLIVGGGASAVDDLEFVIYTGIKRSDE